LKKERRTHLPSELFGMVLIGGGWTPVSFGLVWWSLSVGVVWFGIDLVVVIGVQ